MRTRPPIDEQVVVITGASSGIGRATALAFAARGAAVVLVARRAAALEDLAREIEDAGGRAMAAPADVSVEGDVESAARAAVAAFGRIDTWVNCAGVYAQGLVDDMTIDEYRRVIDVDLLGTIIGTKCALRRMRAQGSGVIVIVSSIVGKRGAPLASAYSAAKAGLDGFAEALRAEIWETDIHVATLYPPSIDTPIFDNALGKLGTRPEPAPPVRDPSWPARLIVHLARYPHPNKFFGWFRYVYIGLHELSPLLADWFLFRTQAFTLGDQPAGPANLFAASSAPPVVRVGRARRGWRGFTWKNVARVVVGRYLATRRMRPSSGPPSGLLPAPSDQ